MMLPSTGSGGAGELVGPREHIQTGPAGQRIVFDADILHVLQNLVGLFRPVSSIGAQSATNATGRTATTHETSISSKKASSDQANDNNDGSIELPHHIPTAEPNIKT